MSGTLFVLGAFVNDIENHLEASSEIGSMDNFSNYQKARRNMPSEMK